MKLDEFKKLEELRLSSLIGDYGSAALKKMTGQAGGKTLQQQMAQDMFIKDFVGDAISSLETAIEGGLVDPKMRNAKPQAAQGTPVDPKSVKPEPTVPPVTTPTTPTAPAAGGLPKTGTNMATGKYKQQQQSTQTLNNYVKGVSQQLGQIQDKAQKIALTKELVNYMADRKDAPEWANALKTAEFVLKKNADGNFAQQAISALRSGKPLALNPAGLASPEEKAKLQSQKDKANRAKGVMYKGQMPQGARPAGAGAMQKGQMKKVAEGWKIYYLNMLVEGAGLTWKDLGLSVLVESTNKGYLIVESRYLKLNNIFESILEAESGKVSISQYLKNQWYPQYMKGVNYAVNQAVIDKGIDAVQATYAKDRGQGALEKLAQVSYAVSKGNVPAGAANIVGKDAGAAGDKTASAEPAQAAQAQAAAQPAQGAMNSHQMAELVKSTMAKLKSVDAKLYAETMKELSSGTPTQGLDAKAAPSAAPAEKPGFVDRPAAAPAAAPAQKVAESKIRRFR
jgi:hypothetical protein